jgi:hypothetical protein
MPTTSCPNCARQIDIYPEDIGTKIECAVCNTRFTVNRPTKPTPPPPAEESHARPAAPKHAESERRYDVPPFNTIIGSASIMAAVCAVSMLWLTIFWPLALPLGLLGIMLGISAILLSNRKRVAGGVMGAIAIMVSFVAVAAIVIEHTERERRQVDHFGAP